MPSGSIKRVSISPSDTNVELQPVAQICKSTRYKLEFQICPIFPPSAVVEISTRERRAPL